jgi:hypothetical protein
MSWLPAAAVPEGAVVKAPDPGAPGKAYLTVRVKTVENATPHPGYIRWIDEFGFTVDIAASVRVEVVSLP